MAVLRPFRALRPKPSVAAKVAAVPYDVVDVQEARTLAEGNPLSFLRVSRAEIDLPPGTDPYSDEVYDCAAANFERLKSSLVVEAEPSLYVYQLATASHRQLGVAGCFSLDEYDRDLIRKHERTRRDKEDDRTRHMIALGAQTGPVFLVHRGVDAVADIVVRATAADPLFDFEAADGVRHTLWRTTRVARDALVAAFAGLTTLYIADGHHRAASAARVRADIRDRGITRSSLGDDADYTSVLGVAFPHESVRILPYNRIVRELGAPPDVFLQRVRERFRVENGGPPVPAKAGELSMYLGGRWHALQPLSRPDPSDVVQSLDVSVLQNQLLEPVLGIADVTTDKRIDFVGGVRGTRELERLVDLGAAAAAFSLYPVSVDDLMAVSDQGAMMPPKSTWFDPKLRDGLLVHLI
jgi:uncharacterized protein (DUF1015 family)